jgi:SAM-dependent methyltransferase
VTASTTQGFTQTFEGMGIVIKHDPMTRRSVECDNVMPILHEEHFVTWSLLGPGILATIAEQRVAVSIDFLDVGTGSGVWAILVAKALARRGATLAPGRIVAVDRAPRMIDACRENLRLNLVDSRAVRLVANAYGADAVSPSSTGAIFMNPPYHIYPPIPEIENRVPLHARGGPLGFEEFQNWLTVANQHLAGEGSVFFHHMCLGDARGPLSERMIPQAIDGVLAIVSHDILRPIETRTFLTSVYGGDHARFVEETSRQYPLLYFSSGTVTRRRGFTGTPALRRYAAPVDLLAGHGWEDRIQLHRRIADCG